MRVENENSTPPPLENALRLVCRLAADAASAPWAAVVPARLGRPVWRLSEPLPPPLERAALEAPDPPAGAVETADGPDGWSAAVGLPGGRGRLMVLSRAPLLLDEPRRGQLADAAGLAAARIAAEEADAADVMAIARIGGFRLDRATSRACWSPEVYRLYGYDPAAGAPSLAMALAAFPQGAQAELLRGIARTWVTGEEVSVASSFTALDGTRRDVVVRLRSDPPDQAGRRASLSGVIFDMTDARSFDRRVDRERALLRTTLDHMDQGIFVVDPDMSLPVLSRRALELLCLPVEFLDARPTFPQLIEYQYETGRITAEQRRANDYIFELRDLPRPEVHERRIVDGKILEVRTTQVPGGGYVRTFTDQTARRRREEEVAHAQAEYRMLFENSVTGIFRTTPDGRLLRANPALVRFSGYDTEAELIAAMGDVRRDWYVRPEQRDELTRRLREEGRVTDYVCEVRRHRTGERVWIAETCWVIRDEAGEIVAYEGAIVDATERKRAEDHIARLARCDALTGLHNRPAFAERLEAALAELGGGSLAMLFFDLDRFKAVNDTLGHPAGDALLRVIARRIEAILGPGDLLARFGGDEFALLAPGAGEGAAAALAERVLEAVRAPTTLEGRAIAMSASVGVALAPRDGADPTALMKHADMALYRAKREGKDRFRMFAAAMDAEAQERRRLEFDLRHAIERGELGLVYQPVVCMARNRAVGFEALLRWTHPERGAVPPQVFVPIAEETGTIGAIGAWVMARACADAAAWPADTRLWVNVSAVQLAQDRFESEVAAALEGARLPADRLVVEITETSLMEERADLAPRLERLRARGVRTALDDFGTGYSSLGYLRRFKFDVLKIDQSFVRDMDDPGAAAILGAVLDLGRRLGLRTVAEGVETARELAALAEAGCELAQGRLFGPHLDAAQARLAASRSIRP